MSLEERYRKKPLSFLVTVVEQAEDYRPEAVDLAKALIREKGDESEVLKAAREVVGEKIRQYLESFSVLSDELELPNSYYLNEEEVKLVFRSQFAAWKNQNDDMIPDSWLYVLGAGFG